MNAEDWCYDHEKAEQVTYGVPQCRSLPVSGAVLGLITLIGILALVTL